MSGSNASREPDCVDMKLLAVSFPLFLALAGCTSSPVVHERDATKGKHAPEQQLAVFSGNPEGSLPHGWEPLVLLRQKKPTEYRLVSKEQRTVLHARADRASSGLMHQVSMDPHTQPWLHWAWKIANPVKGQDNSQKATEDSPVRIILGFDGDKDSLPFTDQILFETAKLVTGYDFPYASLMYIWGNQAPVGSVIRSPHSSRIRMVVAANGEAGIGTWHEFARNIVEDYEKAFGEKPGRLVGVGVLTDTDNTGETVEAWYGDITLLRERLATVPRDDGNDASLILTQRE